MEGIPDPPDVLGAKARSRWQIESALGKLLRDGRPPGSAKVQVGGLFGDRVEERARLDPELLAHSSGGQIPAIGLEEDGVHPVDILRPIRLRGALEARD